MHISFLNLCDTIKRGDIMIKFLLNTSVVALISYISPFILIYWLLFN